MNKSDFYWGFVISAIVTSLMFGMWFSHDTPKFKDSYGIVKRIELSSESGVEKTYKIKIQAFVKGDNDKLWFYSKNNYKVGDTIKIK